MTPYVPGQTPRPPEGAFDHIRATVLPDMSPDDLAATAAFQMGVTYLETGFFWEAHEVLEPVWMVCLPNSIERAVVQGLIQLANARLKAQMGKPEAAKRLHEIARGHLKVGRGAVVMGIDTARLMGEIDSVLPQGIMQYNAVFGAID